MRAHLRADLIRFRGRSDIWVIGFGVPLLVAVTFLQGYMNIPNHYGWDPSQPIPPEILTAIASERGGYAFPHSILAMIGNVPWLLLVAFFLTSMTIGLEYGWGTIRTALLASPDRLRLLASRLLVIAAIVTAMLAIFMVLAVALPAVLVALGNAVPPSPEVVAVEVAGGVAASLVALAFVLSFSALLAIATRNPALPFLVAIVYGIVEGAVGSLSQWRDLHLELVSGSLPIASVGYLLRDAIDPARYGLAQADIGPNVVDRPLLLSFAVVAGWAVLSFVVAAVLLRRSDVTE